MGGASHRNLESGGNGVTALEDARAALEEPAAGMTVVTPSYAPDFHKFMDLHSSVLRHFPREVVHVVVVPEVDLPLFCDLAGPRCRVLPESALLPKGLVRLPGVNWRISTRSLQFPVRGWIIQQMLKLAVADVLDVDVMVMVDSDVLFIRPVDIRDFSRSGQVGLYRLPQAITRALPRHVRWTETAGRLLGLPVGPLPYTDYISSLNTWDRRLVLALRSRIEEVNGRPWTTELGRHLLVSEWVLYGMFVEAVAAGGHRAETSDARCLTYWDEVPLGLDEAVSFFGGVRKKDVAVMLSAKARVADDVRRAAFSELGFLPG